MQMNLQPHNFTPCDTQTFLQSNNMRSSEPNFAFNSDATLPLSGVQMENLGFFQHLSEVPDQYMMDPLPDNVWNSHCARMNPFCFVDSFSNLYNLGLYKTSFDGNMGFEEVRVTEGFPDLEMQDLPPATRNGADVMLKMSSRRSLDLQKALDEIGNAFSDIIVHGDEVSKTFGTNQPSAALITGFSFSNKFSEILSRAASGFAGWASIRSDYRILKFVENCSQNCHNETNMMTSGLSSTLDKLWIWENKLYKEVETEEKLGLAIDKEQRKLYDTYAESSKIEASHLSLERLTPKMNVAIAIVEGVAATTHRIRDEELHPQICEFIQRLHKMWKKLSEAHEKQLYTITEIMSSMEITCSSSDSSYKAVQWLEAETTNLEKAFFNWVKSHRAFPDHLNNWLNKFLPPNKASNLSSPSSPPMLAICNRWNDVVWRISEARVLQALHNFSLLLQSLKLRLHEEWHQRLKMEYLSDYHNKELKKLFVKSGIDRKECAAFIAEADDDLFSAGIIDSRISGLHARYLSLKPIRVKLREVRSRHGQVMEELKAAVPNLLRKGLVPVFDALKNFSLEMCNALEQVL